MNLFGLIKNNKHNWAECLFVYLVNGHTCAEPRINAVHNAHAV